MRYLKCLCVFAVVLALTGQASASSFNLSGEWKLNANGWVYKMILLEKGDQFEGILHPLNYQSPDTQITGRVFPDGRVEFSSVLSGIAQQYIGCVFQGGEKNNAMAGFLSQGSQQFGWFAERLGQTPQPSFPPGTPYAPQTYYPESTRIKMFSTASIPISGTEKATRFEVETIFEKVPQYITATFSGDVTVQPGQRLILAGNADGTADWRVSGFLFVEFRSGYSVRRFVVGSGLDRVKYNGQLIERVGSRGTDFAPYLPQNTPIHVTAYALHYGPGVGSVSDVYLVTK